MMVTVLSQKHIKNIDIASFLNCNPEGYVHIEPSFKRVCIIDLGLGKAAVSEIAGKNYSVNVFNKNFNPDLMLSLKSDCIVVTNGAIETDGYEELKNNLMKMIGKKKMVGFGLGKEILLDAAESLELEFDSSSKLYSSDKFSIELI